MKRNATRALSAAQVNLLPGACGLALAIVWVNGQCPPFDEIGMTCATKFSQRLADFGLSIALFSAMSGIPAIPALGGVVLMLLDLRRWQRGCSAAA